ncbi:CHAD domain-containing protein [Synechococcales cyanobacterium C]|uniref:CHAD domain-containing protein n=1 Tax=Petrachloros mirabilis ULC683 TaxID=2781853 RepID=A0A8K2A8K0_9CYAN|nr:CHAD domain-containing protein [Petrachloros mirabilis]NCJ08119.1 CHAD domain-containing protein [Petrachloros mirabilis ULC683]
MTNSTIQASAQEDLRGRKTSLRLSELMVGEAAHQAIHKHFHKAIKQEASVLKDEDPEPLHQMRVGMRRLRTALQVFAMAVDLPKHAQDAKIRKLARQLGTVRDLDVLLLWFQDYIQTTPMPTTETAVVEGVMQQLGRDRTKRAKQMFKLLRGKRYQNFQSAYESWLAHPTYLPPANRPMALMVPDLLLPLVCNLLCHPGWWVGIHWTERTATPQSLPDDETYHRDWGPPLHDLRKQIKRVRYQAEFLVDFYETDISEYTQSFRQMQDLLGELQDSEVLIHFLKQQLGVKWAAAAPSLSQYFQRQRLDLWQQWQPFQQQYLDLGFRDRLRTSLAQVRPPSQLPLTKTPLSG